MTRRSTLSAAPIAVAMAALLGACSGGSSKAAPTTTGVAATTAVTPAATTAPPSTIAAPTTTVAATTTVAPTTTTTVVTDATQANPQDLARQLQRVVDTYSELYMASRADPDRPYTDQALIDGLRTVATSQEIVKALFPIWDRARSAGTAARPGPSGTPHDYITSVTVASGTRVVATFCGIDDVVVFNKLSGAIVNSDAGVGRGTFEFSMNEGRWRISDLSNVTSTPLSQQDANPCIAEAIAL